MIKPIEYLNIEEVAKLLNASLPVAVTVDDIRLRMVRRVGFPRPIKYLSVRSAPLWAKRDVLAYIRDGAEKRRRDVEHARHPSVEVHNYAFGLVEVIQKRKGDVMLIEIRAKKTKK